MFIDVCGDLLWFLLRPFLPEFPAQILDIATPFCTRLPQYTFHFVSKRIWRGQWWPSVSEIAASLGYEKSASEKNFTRVKFTFDDFWLPFVAPHIDLPTPCPPSTSRKWFNISFCCIFCAAWRRGVLKTLCFMSCSFGDVLVLQPVIFCLKNGKQSHAVSAPHHNKQPRVLHSRLFQFYFCIVSRCFASYVSVRILGSLQWCHSSCRVALAHFRGELGRD